MPNLERPKEARRAMRVDAERLDDEQIQSDVIVIGAGPAGITTCLELARHGHEVALIESGGRNFSAQIQRLSDAASYDEVRHAPMQECSRRQLGGASVIWGGRCVPYDPIDFETRPHIPFADWPLGYEDIRAYFERACDYFRCGRPQFNLHQIDGVIQKSIVPGLADSDVLTSDLERWSLPTHFGREYADELERNPRIRVFSGLTCTEIDVDESGTRVVGLSCSTSTRHKTLRVKGRVYVVACGGIDTTRLLLASNRVHKAGIGNQGGQLGRFYMGHMSGRIAHVQFSTPPKETVYGFDRDSDGTYLRRRFSFSTDFQRRKELANIVGLLVNPNIADAGHRNGVLSFIYLALVSPLGRFFAPEAIRKAALESEVVGSAGQHVRNLVFDFPRTASFIPAFAYRRFLVRRKVPGFFQPSGSNRYLFQYSAEQVPNPKSRIQLGTERDALGMRRVDIDIQYSSQDIDSVIRAHRYWDEHLQSSGVGRFEYIDANLEESVLAQARNGFHQIGTTRMSPDPSQGVVDSDCKVHGVDNLFVASSSNFVTAGQANSTFMIVAFALKMADHIQRGAWLRSEAGGSPPPGG